jgi:hypothetical protein
MLAEMGMGGGREELGRLQLYGWAKPKAGHRVVCWWDARQHRFHTCSWCTTT